jgi:hypothetical protein
MAKRIIKRDRSTGRIIRTDSGAAINESRDPAVVGNPTGNDSVPSGPIDGTGSTASGNSGQVFVDPTEAAGSASGTPDSNDPGRPSRGPGRPRGSTGTKGKTLQGSLTGLLYSLHAMGSVILKTPELELTEGEAKKLGDAAQAVMAFYTDAELPEEVVLWANLIMTMGGIYGPRFVAYKIRNARNVTPKISPAPVPQNVQPIRQTDSKPAPKPVTPQGPGITMQEWSQWNAGAAVINTFE